MTAAPRRAGPQVDPAIARDPDAVAGPAAVIGPADATPMRLPAGGVVAVDTLLSGGNAAVARLASSSSVVWRAPRGGFENADVVGEFVGVTGVPPDLKGDELLIYTVMRIGAMSRDDALALLSTGQIAGVRVDNQGDGAAKAMLSSPELELIRTWKDRRAAEPADVKADGGPLSGIDLDKEEDEESAAERVAVVVADLLTDFTPGVSNVKDALTALTGVNQVTGEPVGVLERVMAGVFAFPVLGNVLKYLAKGGWLLFKAARVLGRALVRALERLPELVRRLRGSSAADGGGGGWRGAAERGRLGEEARHVEVDRQPGRASQTVSKAERDRLLNALENGRITLLDFAQAFGEHGATQVYVRVPGFARGRFVDHLFIENGWVVLRESKTYRDFAVAEGDDLWKQLAKDLAVLKAHPQAVVEWRITGSIDRRTWDLLEAMRESSGEAFRFTADDMTRAAPGRVTPPTKH